MGDHDCLSVRNFQLDNAKQILVRFGMNIMSLGRAVEAIRYRPEGSGFDSR